MSATEKSTARLAIRASLVGADADETADAFRLVGEFLVSGRLSVEGARKQPGMLTAQAAECANVFEDPEQAESIVRFSVAAPCRLLDQPAPEPAIGAPADAFLPTVHHGHTVNRPRQPPFLQSRLSWRTAVRDLVTQLSDHNAQPLPQKRPRET